jgi:PAS domain S-box-containing protein
MTVGELQQQLAQARAMILTLQAELAETNQGLVALTMELEQRVEERATALTESEERFRRLAEAMPQLVWIMDADGKSVYLNRQWIEYAGRKAATVQEWAELIHPEDLKRVTEEWREAVRAGSDFRCSYRFRRRDSEYRWFLARSVVQRDGANGVAGWIGTATDIDDLKRAQDALRRTVEELTRSNKELEQFAYVSSHDLREPLRMVTAFAGLLRKRYQDKLDEKANEYLAFTVEGAERMQALVNDLLEYSRVGGKAQKPVPTNVQESLDAALANLKVSIRESGAKVTRGPLPTVMADGPQLTRLFQNLIGNAVKFRKADVTPEIHIGVEKGSGFRGQGLGGRGQESGSKGQEAGSLKLGTESGAVVSDSSLSASPDFRVSESLPFWLFSVRDNGIGIEPEFSERIFEIFQRLHTREAYPGTGIGLAICKKIVERHGGRIWVESEPGKGSTFFFAMPAAPMDSANG